MFRKKKKIYQFSPCKVELSKSQLIEDILKAKYPGACLLGEELPVSEDQTKRNPQAAGRYISSTAAKLIWQYRHLDKTVSSSTVR